MRKLRIRQPQSVVKPFVIKSCFILNVNAVAIAFKTFLKYNHGLMYYALVTLMNN